MSLFLILGGCGTAQNVPFRYVPRMRKKRQRVESGVIFLIYYYSVICIWHSLFSLYRRMWQTAFSRLSLWADRGKWAAGKRKIASISSPLNLQTITPFSYFRREVPSRGMWAGAVCRKKRRFGKLKWELGSSSYGAISHSRRVWNGAKCAVPLCAENEKTAGKLMIF